MKLTHYHASIRVDARPFACYHSAISDGHRKAYKRFLLPFATLRSSFDYVARVGIFRLA